MLKRILHTCLNRNMFAVEKFSRWLRAICTILLARNRPPDRLKALAYIEQATDVVRDNSEGTDGEEVIILMCMPVGICLDHSLKLLGFA